MVTPEFYYTLKYAFHIAKDTSFGFIPIHPEHMKYRQEKFFEKITKYFNDKNLNIEDLKTILENSNISIYDKIEENDLIKLRKNKKIKAKKNEELLKIKTLIYKYPYVKAIKLINKCFLSETKKHLYTRTENLNLKELFFLKDNGLLFLLNKDTLHTFNRLLENKKIQEADFIWNNYHNDWSIKETKKYILFNIRDKDFLKMMSSDHENLPAVKEINTIICNLTDEDLEDFYSSITMIPLFDRKKDLINELKKIIDKWKIDYERKDLYEILENIESIKKAPNRRL